MTAEQRTIAKLVGNMRRPSHDRWWSGTLARLRRVVLELPELVAPPACPLHLTRQLATCQRGAPGKVVGMTRRGSTSANPSKIASRQAPEPAGQDVVVIGRTASRDIQPECPSARARCHDLSRQANKEPVR